MGKVREPQKKSSIEKKKRIINNGFKLMCNHGYYNVTCVDIAKEANVSIGIIYQYFNDKRDIFILGVKNYSNEIIFPTIEVLQKVTSNNLKDILNEVIDKYIQVHNMSKKAHSQLMAMGLLDKEVAQIFNDYEIKATEKVAQILNNNGFLIENINEKIHVVYGIIDNFCHEIIYHKHKLLNYEVMRNVVVDSVLNILTKKATTD